MASNAQRLRASAQKSLSPWRIMLSGLVRPAEPSHAAEPSGSRPRATNRTTARALSARPDLWFSPAVKIIGNLIGDLSDVPQRVRALEACGYDAAYSAEITNDPFLPLALAAEHSRDIGLMTSVAVAFARNPMTLAATAHDLNAYSRGRFTLGIGSQVKGHIERRFGMPWSKPAARMRELILAMRAIWACWYEGKPLDFRGEFYTHTLMTPMFMPAQTTFGPPRVMLAAVGPRMSEVAGEVADGIVCHGFTTVRYLEEVTLPAVERGLARAGRDRSRFEVACPVIVATGLDAAGREAALQMARQQIAFYASTPAYQPVLELHGWGAVGAELHRLSKTGGWAEMGDVVGDAMLDEFVVAGQPDEIPALLRRRFAGRLDSWLCTAELGDAARQAELVAALRS